MNNKSNSLKTILKSTNNTSCPSKVNFHMHTTYSDGSLTPVELFQQATDIGLKHIAITDHHSIHAFIELKSFLQSKLPIHENLRPKIWSGIEISSILKGCLVHLLGFDFDPFHSKMKPYIIGESPCGSSLRSENVIEAVHSAGGLVFLAHPARYRLPFSELILEASIKGMDGIEVWYDYQMKTNWEPSEYICNQIDKLATSLNLLKSSGTDSHGYSLLGR